MLQYELHHFYDCVFFNSETYFQKDKTSHTLAEMFFRMHEDKLIHERVVYSLSDWLGDIGGINEVLTFVFLAFFGSYLGFN